MYISSTGFPIAASIVCCVCALGLGPLVSLFKLKPPPLYSISLQRIQNKTKTRAFKIVFVKQLNTCD